MSSHANEAGRVTVEVLRERLDRGEPLVVLDVREERERAYAAIKLPPSAFDLHIPMGAIPARLEELRAASKAGPVVVYCHLGVRSKAAADWLVRQGLTEVSDIEDGIDAWSVRIDRTVPRY